MPHASVEKDLEFSTRLLERLLNSAAEVVLSWPRREDDRELLPSPLIVAVPEHAFETMDIPLLKPLEELWLGLQPATCIIDLNGVALNQDSEVPGGTRLLQDQAACPFRAYARHRLGAARLLDPAIEPSPLTRGNLLHRALEFFWNETGSLSVLEAYDSHDLEKCIAASVTHALDNAGQVLTNAVLALENQRLASRMRAWLDIERQRAPFTVVATEQRRQVSLGGIRLTTFADRVDRIDDGRTIIIDYKSGQARRDGWFGERLFEPQLPLYTVTAADRSVIATALAQLRAGGLGFVGTAEKGGLLPRVSAVKNDRQRGDITEWPQLLKHWHASLEQLANEIREGLAVVSPQKPDACMYCDLGDLCRIPAVDDDAAKASESSEEAS
jgi:probable DNA repair protein